MRVKLESQSDDSETENYFILTNLSTNAGAVSEGVPG